MLPRMPKLKSHIKNFINLLTERRILKDSQECGRIASLVGLATVNHSKENTTIPLGNENYKNIIYFVSFVQINFSEDTNSEETIRL